VIGGAHAIMAMTRNEPHWLLTDADAKQYAAALQNAARHFSIGATQKALDVGALIMMAFTMESPRVHRSFALARERRERRPGQAAPGGGATVYTLHPGNPGNPQQPPANGAAPAAQPPAGGGLGTAAAGVEGFTGDGVDRSEMGPL
jgi:hypothetical protein